MWRVKATEWLGARRTGCQPRARRKGRIMFGRTKKDDAELTFRQLWDRERARAMTPAERAEVDAIFARYA
jgi:hypothetical protein